MAPTDTSTVAAMRRAIALGARGHGRVSPNPAVGCVILDAAGHTRGQGWHERAGGPHAEVAALDDARGYARGGTAVVTLEPCSHTGRTPACTQALIEAGIRTVCYAVDDPLHGGGADQLRQAGLEVRRAPDELVIEAVEMNQAWLTAARLGRPHITWKFAASLDGRSASADGTSRWITGEAARADAHLLRDTVDAVLIGAGTQRTDDPQLTVRPAPSDGRQPLRVVLDPSGRTPPDARVLDTAAPSLLIQDRATDPPIYPDHVHVAIAPRGDLPSALAVLHRRGIRSVLLEGGPRLAGQFVATGLVDRVIAYVAPALLGAGPAALADSAVTTIADTHRLELLDTRRVGNDLRITGRPRRRHTETKET